MKKTKIQAAPDRARSVFGKLLPALMMLIGGLRLFQTYYLRYDPTGYSGVLDVEILLSWALAVCAAGYLLYSFFTAKRSQPVLGPCVKEALTAEQLILIVFFLWQLIGCMASNANFGGKALESNRSPLFDSAISFFVLFPIAFFLKDGFKKISGILVHIFMFVLTGVMLYILWNVFQNNILNTPSGGIGMTKSLNLVICTHYNTVGAYAAAAALVCIAIALRSTRVCLKVLYVLFTLVHWVVLMLTQSRTSIISAVFTISIGVFVALFMFLRNRRGLVPRAVISLAAAILTGYLLMASRHLVFAFFESISHLSEILEAQGDAVASGLRKMEADGNISSRFNTWIVALRCMVYDAKHFLFGATSAGVIPMLDYVGQTSNNWYTHNQFLEMGVAYGVPGMLMYTGWLVLIARNCLRIGLNHSNDVTMGDRFIPLILLSLVVSNLTEAMLVGCTYMPGCVFFLLSGWVCAKARTLPPVKIKALL